MSSSARVITGETRKALEYVRNTGGGATLARFLEDFDPIGSRLWFDLVADPALVAVDRETRTISLTPEGEAELLR
jgi:hypothetical protein